MPGHELVILFDAHNQCTWSNALLCYSAELTLCLVSHVLTKGPKVPAKIRSGTCYMHPLLNTLTWEVIHVLPAHGSTWMNDHIFDSSASRASWFFTRPELQTLHLMPANASVGPQQLSLSATHQRTKCRSQTRNLSKADQSVRCLQKQQISTYHYNDIVNSKCILESLYMSWNQKYVWSTVVEYRFFKFWLPKSKTL